MDPEALQAFVVHFYNQFDSNRANLAWFYQEGSMLTFQGEQISGVQNIVGKLTSLPFEQCRHIIYSIDCQPSGPPGGMLVFVSGSLQFPGEQRQLKFSEVFHLIPTPPGSYYVLNIQMSPHVTQNFHVMPTPAGSYHIINDILRINYA